MASLDEKITEIPATEVLLLPTTVHQSLIAKMLVRKQVFRMVGSIYIFVFLKTRATSEPAYLQGRV